MNIILKEWNKFRGWTILEWFIKYNKKIHIKGLAKELKVSPNTAHRYLKLYEKAGLLSKEKIGNVVLYYLDNSNSIVHELRKLYQLMSE